VDVFVVVYQETVVPPSLQRIWLSHHTHMDIGYTDLPGEVQDQHLGHLDRVLALCRGNGSRPESQQFRWTIESAWLVRDYLACRPQAQGRELLDALRAGWLELQAFLTQPLTELASADDLIECLSYAVSLGNKEGFPVRCGMIDDIGGYAGRLPSIMAEMGVPYLVAGVGAFQVYVPWADLPHLFYLEDKADHRVLVWNLGIDRSLTPQDMTNLDAVYGQAGLFLVNPFAKALTGQAGRGTELDLEDTPEVADAHQRFASFKARLEREKYPHTDLFLQYGGDNRGPDEALLGLVEKLNQRDDLPKITLGNPTAFFQHMEATLGDSIPVIRGALTDPWNLRANPTPSALKTFRKAQRELLGAEARQTLLPGSPRMEQMFNQCRVQLQLYIDHTCGLSEWGWEKVFDGDCHAPVFDRYRQSWAIKRQYADQALAVATKTGRRSFQTLASAGADAPSVAVANDSPFPVSGPVELYTGRGGITLSGLLDEEGNAIPLQQIGNRRYVFVSPEIPAFGMRWFRPEFGGRPAVDESEFSSDFLEIAYDPATGLVNSLRARTTGKEWLDGNGPGLGATIYETLSNVEFGQRQAGMSKDWERELRPVHTERVALENVGPVFADLVVGERIDGPSGPIRVHRTVRLYRHSPRVDVFVRVDKPETNVKETLHIAFPLTGPGEFGFDQGSGWLDPARDLAPGAMQDIFYANSCVWAHDGGSTAVLSVPDAPIVSLGRIRTGEWLDGVPFSADSNAIYAFVYHNLLNTDCAIWQSILDEFRFSLVLSDQRLSPEQAMEKTGSLRACLFETASPSPNRPDALIVTPSELRLHSVRPAPDGGILLVENPTDSAIEAHIAMSRPLQAAWHESLAGQLVDELDLVDNGILVPVPPFQLVRVGFLWSAEE
jgi:hypothetical protein